MDDMIIRTADADDASAIAEIYAYYTRYTAVSFEVDPPSADEMADRIRRYAQKYPYLVIEDEDEEILGFAFAHAFRERPAYDYAVETTIYLRPGERHRGLGRAIYTVLEDELRRMGVISLYACIAVSDAEDEYLNADSPRFHAAMGYKTCGEFKNCGRKFNRWYDMIWMEKLLGDFPPQPAPIVPYPAALRIEKGTVREPLSSYDAKRVRLVTVHGDMLRGKASHFPAEFGEHELGVAEEGLQLGSFVCYKSDIAGITEIG